MTAAHDFQTDPAVDLIRDAIPADKPDWTENICWTMHDPASGISLYCHMGRMQPDRSVWEGLSLFYLPNGEVLVNRNLGVSVAEARNREYDYKPVMPTQLWRYRFDGMVQRAQPQQLRTRPVADEPFEHAAYDFVFEAVHPVHNRHNSTPESERMHLEQGGRLKGHFTIAGERIDIDCTAYRDHSVSRRTFKTLDSETWAHCAFPSGKSFGIMEVRRTEIQVMNGLVWQNGEMQEATADTIADATDTAGGPHSGTIRLKVASGTIDIAWETVEGRFANFNLLRPVGLRPGLDLSNPEAMLGIQCPTKFTWDGEVGYGWMERVRRTSAVT